MEAIKKFLAFVWTCLFDDCHGQSGSIKWVSLIIAVVINSCSGMASDDKAPLTIICVFVLVHFLTWAIVSYRNFEFEKSRFWHPAWFFAAMVTILFTYMFRFGYENETYFDRNVGQVVEVAPVNFMPLFRYQIIAQEEWPTDIGAFLQIKQKVGRANVIVNFKMMVTSDQNKVMDFVVKQKLGVFGAHVSTSNVLNRIAGQFREAHMTPLTTAIEPTEPGFAEKYGQMVKDYFAEKGVPIEGQLVIRQADISPYFYLENGEIDMHQ